MWWYGRGNSGGFGCQKRKKLICGTEEEIVVTHGRLPSAARQVRQVRLRQFLGRALPHLQMAVVIPRASRSDV